MFQSLIGVKGSVNTIERRTMNLTVAQELYVIDSANVAQTNIVNFVQIRNNTSYRKTGIIVTNVQSLIVNIALSSASREVNPTVFPHLAYCKMTIKQISKKLMKQDVLCVLKDFILISREANADEQKISILIAQKVTSIFKVIRFAMQPGK